MEQTIYRVRNYKNGKLQPAVLRRFFNSNKEVILICEIDNNTPVRKEDISDTSDYSVLTTYTIKASYSFLEDLFSKSNAEWDYVLSTMCETENMINNEYFAGWKDLTTSNAT